MQGVRQALHAEVVDVHPHATVRQGAQVQLRAVRQEIQVQTQTAIASHVEHTRAAATITIEIFVRDDRIAR